jgi:hypothetical protein
MPFHRFPFITLTQSRVCNIDDGGESARNARARDRTIADRRRLADMAHSQQTELAKLRAERDRLRQCTYPSFMHLRGPKAIAPDEKSAVPPIPMFHTATTAAAAASSSMDASPRSAKSTPRQSASTSSYPTPPSIPHPRHIYAAVPTTNSGSTPSSTLTSPRMTRSTGSASTISMTTPRLPPLS